MGDAVIIFLASLSNVDPPWKQWWVRVEENDNIDTCSGGREEGQQEDVCHGEVSGGVGREWQRRQFVKNAVKTKFREGKEEWMPFDSPVLHEFVDSLHSLGIAVEQSNRVINSALPQHYILEIEHKL
ncbi:hypothetical protein V8G54_024737 [Vigna mungo]|uniref:Uncharacterized protein n=1 Tax=Vigna mungo TaxID=3915 RepID=A0AAQ3RTQ6_VIGMU